MLRELKACDRVDRVMRYEAPPQVHEGGGIEEGTQDTVLIGI
jgi:hypothetical protein